MFKQLFLLILLTKSLSIFAQTNSALEQDSLNLVSKPPIVYKNRLGIYLGNGVGSYQMVSVWQAGLTYQLKDKIRLHAGYYRHNTAGAFVGFEWAENFHLAKAGSTFALSDKPFRGIVQSELFFLWGSKKQITRGPLFTTRRETKYTDMRIVGVGAAAGVEYNYKNRFFANLTAALNAGIGVTNAERNIGGTVESAITDSFTAQVVSWPLNLALGYRF